MASVICSRTADIFTKSAEVFAEKAPITANAASVAGDFFKSQFSEDLSFEVSDIVSKIDAKIIEGMEWGYWKKVASAVKNFFVHGFSWEKAVSSPYLLFRALPTDRKSGVLEKCRVLASQEKNLSKLAEYNLVIKSLECEIKSLKISDSLIKEGNGLLGVVRGSGLELHPTDVKDLLQKYMPNDFNDLPVLNLSTYDGSADYIQRISDKDMRAPIMRFIGSRGSRGIAFSVFPKESSKNTSVPFTCFDLSCQGGVILYMQHTDEASESSCWTGRADVVISSIYEQRQRENKGISEKKDYCGIGSSKLTYDIGIKELEALLSGTDPDLALGIL